jgi:hypothetical protein
MTCHADRRDGLAVRAFGLWCDPVEIPPCRRSLPAIRLQSRRRDWPGTASNTQGESRVPQRSDDVRPGRPVKAIALEELRNFLELVVGPSRANDGQD